MRSITACLAAGSSSKICFAASSYLSSAAVCSVSTLSNLSPPCSSDQFPHLQSAPVLALVLVLALALALVLVLALALALVLALVLVLALAPAVRAGAGAGRGVRVALVLAPRAGAVHYENIGCPD
ncbi:hypothetical protein Salat_1043600 [Sesamum alatum]|uniref:Uncharacterized protein n=1 Tax=Sesamum alatum TaxID=300844 RepID=A0AAE2CSS3_9LAMI|nr:hypothetical protein Salat_1043600 [Sesamum alatum]